MCLHLTTGTGLNTGPSEGLYIRPLSGSFLLAEHA